MDISISSEEFIHLQQGMRDLRVSQLEDQVAQLQKERDQWMARALKLEEIIKASDKCFDPKMSSSEKIIVLSVTLLKKIMSKIHDLKTLGVFALIMQKTMIPEYTSEDYCSIAELIPLPQNPTITLTAHGDIDVEGDWNDIHNNEAVNL